MREAQPAGSLLPLPLPQRHSERMVLVAMRRMAAHGIRDAQAALVMLDLFGAQFRRPLVLLRAFMLDFARAAQRPVKLAPCCSLRMTEDEGRLLDALRLAAHHPTVAEAVLSHLSGSECVCEPLSTAAVFGRALEDWELARA